MSHRRAALSVGAVLLATVTACTPTAAQPAGDRAAGRSDPLPVGTGPQSSYTVQPQPAPGSCHYRYTADKQPLPDPACTPGATSPAVTQANLRETVCKPGGYTSTVRPPAEITGKEKAENAKAYGYTGPLSDAEFDHYVPLSLGGDPNDSRNLWVEPPSPDHIPGKGTLNDKDLVETHLHSALCKNQVTLTDAQKAIATDWTTAEATLGIRAAGTATGPVETDS